ncbi:hypothetical protein DFH94DRAFT_856216, partial [Russula ochroleuca]
MNSLLDDGEWYTCVHTIADLSVPPALPDFSVRQLFCSVKNKRDQERCASGPRNQEKVPPCLRPDEKRGAPEGRSCGVFANDSSGALCDTTECAR